MQMVHGSCATTTVLSVIFHPRPFEQDSQLLIAVGKRSVADCKFNSIFEL